MLIRVQMIHRKYIAIRNDCSYNPNSLFETNKKETPVFCLLVLNMCEVLLIFHI